MIDRLRLQEEDPSTELSDVLKRQGHVLEEFIRYEEVLTPEALRYFGQDFTEAAMQTADSVFKWPDRDSELAIVPDSPILLLLREGADTEFILPIISKGDKAYNNFHTLISANPVTSSPEVTIDSCDQDPRNSYGFTPCLIRAHALFPELMGSLQRTAENIDISQYHIKLLEGFIDPEYHSSEAALLTASRLAYVLLARLMRTDDMKIACDVMGYDPSLAALITDPVAALRT